MKFIDQQECPPGPNDDDAYIYIDHREEDSSIVTYISSLLEPDDILAVNEADEEFFVKHRGIDYTIPLQCSMHDRYITLSSLAEILSDRYNFYLLSPSLESDTHAVTVVTKSVAEKWGKLPDHLQQLDLGYDYFNGIRIPYLNHEGSATKFSADKEIIDSIRDAADDFFTELLSGQITDKSAKQIARIALSDEGNSNQRIVKSEEELAAEIKAEMNEALSGEEIQEALAEFERAMADLRAIATHNKQ